MFDRIVHSIDLITVGIVAIFFILLGYRPPWWTKKVVECIKNVKDIPGPLSLPILGTRWTFSVLGGYTFNTIHEFYKDVFHKYGPIVKEEALWNYPIINIVERRDIEKVVRTSGRYPIRPPTEVIAHYRKTRPDRYASAGLVNEQGQKWQFLRSNLTSDLTSPRTISSFTSIIEEIADDWSNLLKQHRTPDGQINNLEKLSSRLGLETTCALVLGRRMGFLLPDGESDSSCRLAHAVHEHFIACRDTYFGLPFWKLYETSGYKRIVKSEEEIYSLALELIESADESTKESAIFQSVLKANIDEREKTAAIVDFIAAGIHTLGNSLVFLLYCIASHPNVQNKLIEELKLPTGTSYLKACVNETFRYIPTANVLARIAEQDLELSGYHISKGSILLCHTGLACRDDNNFKNANEFMPERWLGDEKLNTMAAATHLVIPFGIGRRACPGKRFIEQVLPIILSNTVQNFTISSQKSLELQFEFLLAPKGPITLTFEDRI